ncbi:MAG: alpha/beta fold hydrolase [Candidatus Brocadiae bacterium]|nr:alpha/beta fold hydrolase [Candidatus Brocadiia bacterium]
MLPFALTQVREFGSLVSDGIPEIPSRIIDRMNQYQNVRSASFLDWNPSGEGILITTRFGDTNQIHFVQSPGGARQQVTFFREPVSSAKYYPGKEKQGFLFAMDIGGGEFYQLFYFDLNTGKSTLLTDGKARNTGATYSHSGKEVFFSSNLRNGKDMDIRILSLDRPGVSEIILQTKGQWRVTDTSSDNKILLLEYISINESYLYWYDIPAKKLSPVAEKCDQKISYGDACWSGDGKGIYYTSDESGEFKNLYYHDLATGKKENLSAHISWDIEEFHLSKDGKKLVYVSNEDGISKLRLIDAATKTELPLPELPVCLISGISFNQDDTQLGLTINSPQSPSDAYSIRLATQELIRWTYSEVGGLNKANFVTPKLIHYPTFDSIDGKARMIPAFYYHPKQSQGKIPVVISIHGGPESQELPGFNSYYQYLINELGVAVIAPNVRGSAGYGKTYLTLDNGFKREDSVKDIGSLIEWIHTQDQLDAKKIAVYGGSYGGYMVLSSMYLYHDKIKAGIDIVGISNLVTFLENTQEYRRDLRRVEYGDERDPQMREYLIKIAPTTNAKKITSPLFIVQGLNDPRVPASESEQMVKTIRENNGAVWYLLAKNEGHGFRKKVNRDYYLNAMILFWEMFLLDITHS